MKISRKNLASVFAVRNQTSVTRKILESVNITGKGTTGTDARVLVNVSLPDQDPVNGQSVNVNVDGKKLSAFGKNIPNGKTPAELQVIDIGEVAEKTVKLTAGSVTQTVDVDDCDYPAWQGYIPGSEPTFRVRLSAEYLEIMAKAMRVFAKGESDEGFIFEFHGDSSPIKITKTAWNGQEFLGVFMPLRP